MRPLARAYIVSYRSLNRDDGGLKRQRAFPFNRVEMVRPRERTVVLRLDRVTLDRSP